MFREEEERDQRENIQLCKYDSSYSSVKLPPNSNPWIHDLAWNLVKKAASLSHAPDFSLSSGTITYFKSLSSAFSYFAFTSRADLLLWVKHTAPLPGGGFNRAAFLTFLTSLLHFRHYTSPFSSMCSQAVCFCSVSACTALLCSPRKWRQLAMEHGSGHRFGRTALCAATAKESLEICVSVRQFWPLTVPFL